MNLFEYPVTMLLIAANVLFSMAGFSNNRFMTKTLMWPYYVKREGQYYRFITSGFLHADWMHLFFNMFTFYFFGRNIEILFSVYNLGGNITYILLYFLALIISDLPGYFKNRDNHEYRALGASGAVSAVVFASIVFAPWQEIRLYAVIKLSATLFAVLYIIYCVSMSKKGNDNVNHDAHLWGSIFGVVFTLILISTLQPDLFSAIIEELKHPSLFGR